MSEHEQILERWFAWSGWTREQLIAEIERSGSGRPIPGLSVDLGLRMIKGITNPALAIAVWRAGQHMAITRPWEKQPAQAEMAI